MGRISDLHVEIQEFMIKELKTKGYVMAHDVFVKFPFLDENRPEDWQTIQEIYSFVREES